MHRVVYLLALFPVATWQINLSIVEGILNYQEACESESGTTLEHFVDVTTENAEWDHGTKCFMYCFLRKSGLIDDGVNANIDKMNEWFAESNATKIIDDQWKAKCPDLPKDDLCEAAYLLMDCLPYD